MVSLESQQGTQHAASVVEPKKKKEPSLISQIALIGFSPIVWTVFWLVVFSKLSCNEILNDVLPQTIASRSRTSYNGSVKCGLPQLLRKLHTSKAAWKGNIFFLELNTGVV